MPKPFRVGFTPRCPLRLSPHWCWVYSFCSGQAGSVLGRGHCTEGIRLRTRPDWPRHKSIATTPSTCHQPSWGRPSITHPSFLRTCRVWAPNFLGPRSTSVPGKPGWLVTGVASNIVATVPAQLVCGRASTSSYWWEPEWVRVTPVTLFSHTRVP